jgi:hypothetical protein
MNLNICVSNRDAKFSLALIGQMLYFICFRWDLYMSTAEALCIKNTLTDQIGLGHLISKHEMFCFEKTVLFKICSKRPHESEHEWTRDNTSEHESKICEHESKTDEHEWTRVKNDDHEWTRVKNLWTRVKNAFLKRLPTVLSPWWRSVLCNCTRDSQDYWRPTGCWSWNISPLNFRLVNLFHAIRHKLLVITLSVNPL